MRCNVSQKRMLETVEMNDEVISMQAAFNSYRVSNNADYLMALKVGHDSIQAAFIAGYLNGDYNARMSIKERLYNYFEKLRDVEIKRTKKRIKEIMR